MRQMQKEKLRLTQIAPDLAKAAAKMAVRGREWRFQKCGVLQSRQAGE